MNDKETKQFNLLKSRWDDILNYMKEEYDIQEVSINAWIKKLSLYSLEDTNLFMKIDDTIVQFIDMINDKYVSALENSILHVTDIAIQLHILSENELSDKHTKKERNRTTPNPSQNPLLDDAYTFDNFIAGTNNFYTYQYCLGVAEAPGKTNYNPLFIYGGVGLGKTHLMKAIGNHILHSNPDMNVLYVTSETFTNDVVETIRGAESSKQMLRQKYRNVDVLLIDDIQFFIGKESTQLEFFNTFNALIDGRKQIVMTSDRAPKDLKEFEDRMRSRFQSGLTIDMQTPDYETRVAILKKKSEEARIEISEDAIDYIATKITSNVRELEGALKNIIAVAQFTRKKIDLEIVKKELDKIISEQNHHVVTIEYIMNIVSDHYHITTEDIMSKKRSSNIAYPRQICMYLCHEYLDVTLQEIADKMGGKNHSTIIYGSDKIKKDMQTNMELKHNIDILVKKINPV